MIVVITINSDHQRNVLEQLLDCAKIHIIASFYSEIIKVFVKVVVLSANIPVKNKVMHRLPLYIKKLIHPLLCR